MSRLRRFWGWLRRRPKQDGETWTAVNDVSGRVKFE